jgi:hypothetical protein
MSLTIARLITGLACAVASLLACANPPATEISGRLIPDYHARSKVFLVTPEGKVSKVFPPNRQEFSGKGQEITDVAVAPDNNRIAYTQNNDLSLFDPGTGKSTRLTRIGKPYTKTHTSVEVVNLEWSPDGAKLLYQVVAGDNEDPEGDQPTLKTRTANYGHYIFDLATGKTTRYRHSPGIWLSKDEFLLVTKDGMFRQEIASGKLTPLPIARLGDLGQIMLRSNGRQLLAVLDTTLRMNSSQVVQIDLDKFESKLLTPLGKWTEYQWPTYSPSSSRYCYLHRTGQSKDKHPLMDIVVGKKVIYSYEGHQSLFWIDDNTLAVIVALNRSRELVVLDVDSGTVKARHPWE